MSDRRPLTAAVIGAGAGGTLSIDALLASDDFTLVAVADMSEAALERVRAKDDAITTYTSAEEMFAASPTDVVCVSTYAPTHLPLTRAALAIPGIKGLLVEKPLGDTTAAGTEILGLIKDAGLPVVVPHGLMAQSAALEVVQRVRAGDIGTLRVVEIECTNWDIINAGIHWLQFFVALTGGEDVDFVLAAADASTRTFRDGMQVETDAVTLARTVSGVRMFMHTGDYVSMSRTGLAGLFRIIGDDGFIEFGAYEPYYTLVTPGHDRERVDVEQFAVSGHQRHLEFLAAQIADGTRDYSIPDSSLQALEIVEAAYESARAHGTVVLPIDGEQPERPTDWNPGAPYSGVGGGRNGREL
ncbi:Gfo/Idh/MocA family protein [Microbacterium sp.]|uniref:Gfo/Idh/MocA family protein n=2 Tax=Microbacterium sp. TaxID=51671 RepID=UPI001AD5519C|nr:Gfo/Idh/MocA family oxidoreductase [Microbacterium sp.]MBN9186519.1 Gfo/Idh/MocA family oxidoreductase [Microbacterium sp.]MBN9194215.1 Gfo/Idh/MocA family oxidoreductase [Microbacterium sp.]